MGPSFGGVWENVHGPLEGNTGLYHEVNIKDTWSKVSMFYTIINDTI
jgi:hypothetical protein